MSKESGLIISGGVITVNSEDIPATATPAVQPDVLIVLKPGGVFTAANVKIVRYRTNSNILEIHVNKSTTVVVQ